MIKVTRWSPDTCGCVLEYQWDTDDPELNRRHTFLPPQVVCPVHAGLPSDRVSTEVLRENRTKNYALEVITGSFGLGEGETGWRFLADRTLELRVGSKLSRGDLLSLQDALDLQFGPGRTLVN